MARHDPVGDDGHALIDVMATYGSFRTGLWCERSAHGVGLVLVAIRPLHCFVEATAASRGVGRADTRLADQLGRPGHTEVVVVTRRQANQDRARTGTAHRRRGRPRARSAADEPECMLRRLVPTKRRTPPWQRHGPRARRHRGSFPVGFDVGLAPPRNAPSGFSPRSDLGSPRTGRSVN